MSVSVVYSREPRYPSLQFFTLRSTNFDLAITSLTDRIADESVPGHQITFAAASTLLTSN